MGFIEVPRWRRFDESHRALVVAEKSVRKRFQGPDKKIAVLPGSMLFPVELPRIGFEPKHHSR